MTRYTATIRHHSLSRAPVVPLGDSLHAAKINATREFGGGFNEHRIVIMDAETPESPVVAWRKMDSNTWEGESR